MFKEGDILALTEEGLKALTALHAQNFFMKEIKVFRLYGGPGLMAAETKNSPWVMLGYGRDHWFEKIIEFEYEEIEPQVV